MLKESVVPARERAHSCPAMNASESAVPAAGIFAVSCNFRTASPRVSDRLALSRERISALCAAGALGAFSERVLLSTCNRTEFYVVPAAADFAAGESDFAEKIFQKIADCAAEITGVPAAEILENSEKFAGAAAVAHLFCVAAGLDSQMVGEAEIFGQVKNAYETARAAGTVGATLNRVFQKSFHEAKRARTQTGIAAGRVSVGSVVTELALRIFGTISRCSVLVFGTGEAGRKTAQAFVSRGAARVRIFGRNPVRARELAAALGAETFDAGTPDAAEFVSCAAQANVIVGCASVSEPFVSAETLREIARSRGEKPLLLIDLGVPHNFPPDVDAPNLQICGLDELAQIANGRLALREREAAACRADLTARAERLFSALPW